MGFNAALVVVNDTLINCMRLITRKFRYSFGKGVATHCPPFVCLWLIMYNKLGHLVLDKRQKGR